MTTPEDVYRKLRPLYDRFSERLADLLRIFLTDSGIRFQAIEWRAKDVDSFKQKISRPEKRYTDPMHEVNDLAGVRVILYYIDDVEPVADLIRSEFIVDESNSSDRGATLKPNEFGYRSLHFVVGLSTIRSHLAEWRAFGDFKAEIQIRTVLQHAWAAISHTFAYKSSTDMPQTLSRKLYRISGLLELADEEFAAIHKQGAQLEARTVQAIAEGDLTLPIDAISLSSYIEQSAAAKAVTTAAVTAGFTLASSDESPNEGDRFEDLAWTAEVAGIRSIEELDRVCRENLHRLGQFFGQLLEDEEEWYGRTVFFITCALICLRPDRFSDNVLVQRGWSSEIARKVIRAAKSLRANKEQ